MSDISKQLFLIRISDKIAAADIIAAQQQANPGQAQQPPKKKSNWKKWALGGLALAGTAAAAYAGRNHIKDFGSKMLDSGKKLWSAGKDQAANVANNTGNGDTAQALAKPKKSGILQRYGELMTGSKKERLRGLANEKLDTAVGFSDQAKKFASDAQKLTDQHKKKIGHLDDAVKAMEDTNPGKITRFMRKLTGNDAANKAFDDTRMDIIKQRDTASDLFDKAKAEGGDIFNLKAKADEATGKMGRYLEQYQKWDDAASNEALKSWGARIGTGAAAVGAGLGIAKAAGAFKKKKPEPQKKKGFLPENMSFSNPQVRDAGIGVGAGGLLGAGLGYLADDRRGAILGGLAGAGLGGYAGYNFDHLLNKYSKDEDDE